MRKYTFLISSLLTLLISGCADKSSVELSNSDIHFETEEQRILVEKESKKFRALIEKELGIISSTFSKESSVEGTVVVKKSEDDDSSVHNVYSPVLRFLKNGDD